MSSTEQTSMRSYIIGFGLSVILTLTAYFLVVNGAGSKTALIAAILALAVTQLFVQLYFFLHLGHEAKPRWKSIIFLFMGLVLLILVLGSLWIMYNLDYNMMMPEDMDAKIIEDEGYRLRGEHPEGH